MEIINTSDIQRVLNVSPSTARRRMADLKCVYGKKRHQVITWSEFSNYYGIPEYLVNIRKH